MTKKKVAWVIAASSDFRRATCKQFKKNGYLVSSGSSPPRGKIDVVIHAALASGAQRQEHLDHLLEKNLLAFWISARDMYSSLQTGTMVIHVISKFAITPTRSHPISSACAAGVAVFSRALRLEWQDLGVKVITVFVDPNDTSARLAHWISDLASSGRCANCEEIVLDASHAGMVR